jgi:hypothetical protein
MTCYNIPATNCTSAAGKFLPNVKEIFDKPREVMKRMSMYVIYNKIDANYYGDNNYENYILKKVE